MRIIEPKIQAEVAKHDKGGSRTTRIVYVGEIRTGIDLDGRDGDILGRES